ncbi:MAG: Flp pilus assembly complex ATPase component TadA [Pirellulales bacterium]|nr:Flp pilus assembly complex ATPase component TadA [Pirellulales bacterium]
MVALLLRRSLARRSLIVPAVLVGVVFLSAGLLRAETWPEYPLKSVPQWRGAGFYLSWWKIFLCWLLFLCWVRTTNWINIDLQAIDVLDYRRWNPIVFGTFFGTFLLTWIIPYFWLAFALLVIAYVAPLAVYVISRNAKVPNNERVLTPEHLRYCFAVAANKVGIKVAYEKRDPHRAGPPLMLSASHPDERTATARLLTARQMPGLLAAREVLYDAVSNRASAIMLDFGASAVAVNLMIDGVWIQREALERDTADPALEALKALGGLNPQDRQSRQQGPFLAEYDDNRLQATLATQGTAKGERAMIQFEQKKIHFKTFQELGMRPKMEEDLRRLLGGDQGFLLFAAPPANGLRSMVDVTLHCTDRLTREFTAVEEETRRYEAVENVPVTTYKAADGQTPADILPKVFRTLPNVIVIRDLVNAKTVNMLIEDMLLEPRLVLSTIRAKDGAEAILRIASLGVPAPQLAKVLGGVLSVRLIRKLCDSCKEAYQPTPQVLSQLGIPEGRVQAFYRPRPADPENPKEICKTCFGIGYYGRTAIFELMPVGENVRKVLQNTPQPDYLRAAARKDGMKNLQEEGILLVAKGVTSLPELMRVLKQ